MLGKWNKVEMSTQVNAQTARTNAQSTHTHTLSNLFRIATKLIVFANITASVIHNTTDYVVASNLHETNCIGLI
jgi:hypothetical protein